jgi:hypothetical protein
VGGGCDARFLSGVGTIFPSLMTFSGLYSCRRKSIVSAGRRNRRKNDRCDPDGSVVVEVGRDKKNTRRNGRRCGIIVL